MNPNNKSKKIEIRLETRVNLLNREWGRKFLMSLPEVGGGCFEPNKYNWFEPVKHLIKDDGLDKVLEHWDWGLMLKRLRPPSGTFWFQEHYVQGTNRTDRDKIYHFWFWGAKPSDGAISELLEYLIRETTPLWIGVASQIHFYDKTRVIYTDPADKTSSLCCCMSPIDEKLTSNPPFLEGIFARTFIGDELIQKFNWEEKFRKPPFPAERHSCGVLLSAYDDILASDWEKEDAIADYLGWQRIADVRKYYRKHHVIPIETPMDRNIFANDRCVIPEEFFAMPETRLETLLSRAEEYPEGFLGLPAVLLEQWLSRAEDYPRIHRWISSIADGSFWAELLTKVPAFSDRCPWKKLNGADWARLLEKQPQFADRCPWEKLDSADWAGLLEKQPQFAERRA